MLFRQVGPIEDFNLILPADKYVDAEFAHSLYDLYTTTVYQDRVLYFLQKLLGIGCPTLYTQVSYTADNAFSHRMGSIRRHLDTPECTKVPFVFVILTISVEVTQEREHLVKSAPCPDDQPTCRLPFAPKDADEDTVWHHANLLVFDATTRLVHQYEPHGAYATFYDSIPGFEHSFRHAMASTFEDLGYRFMYHTETTICPRWGPQSIFDMGDGMCEFHSFYELLLRLLNGTHFVSLPIEVSDYQTRLLNALYICLVITVDPSNPAFDAGTLSRTDKAILQSYLNTVTSRTRDNTCGEGHDVHDVHEGSNPNLNPLCQLDDTRCHLDAVMRANQKEGRKFTVPSKLDARVIQKCVGVGDWVNHLSTVVDAYQLFTYGIPTSSPMLEGVYPRIPIWLVHVDCQVFWTQPALQSWSREGALVPLKELGIGASSGDPDAAAQQMVVFVAQHLPHSLVVASCLTLVSNYPNEPNHHDLYLLVLCVQTLLVRTRATGTLPWPETPNTRMLSQKIRDLSNGNRVHPVLSRVGVSEQWVTQTLEEAAPQKPTPGQPERERRRRYPANPSAGDVGPHSAVHTQVGSTYG